MILGYLLSARLCAWSRCGSQMDTKWILLQGAPGQLRRQTVSLECERLLVQGMWECLQLMELWEPLLGGSASPEAPELDFPSRVGVRDTSGYCHLWMHFWSEQPGVSNCGTYHCYHSMGLCLWETSLIDHHTLSCLSVTYASHYVLEDSVTLAQCSSVISRVPIGLPHRCPQTRVSTAITM